MSIPDLRRRRKKKKRESCSLNGQLLYDYVYVYMNIAM